MSNVTVVAKRVKPRLFMTLVAEHDMTAGTQVLDCRGATEFAVRTWRTVQLAQGRHMQHDLVDYINHSCDPNCVLDGETPAIVAIHDIKKGDAITIYYPGSEVELAQAFDCQCATAKCQGPIKGAFFLSREQMRSAIDNGYCTSFIKRELLRLLEPTKRAGAVSHHGDVQLT